MRSTTRDSARRLLDEEAEYGDDPYVGFETDLTQQFPLLSLSVSLPVSVSQFAVVCSRILIFFLSAKRRFAATHDLSAKF